MLIGAAFRSFNHFSIDLLYYPTLLSVSKVQLLHNVKTRLHSPLCHSVSARRLHQGAHVLGRCHSLPAGVVCGFTNSPTSVEQRGQQLHEYQKKTVPRFLVLGCELLCFELNATCQRNANTSQIGVASEHV